MDLKDCIFWQKVMVEEMITLDMNEVWDLVELSYGMMPTGRKWFFKRMSNVEGITEKYKKWLAANDYS